MHGGDGEDNVIGDGGRGGVLMGASMVMADGGFDG